MSLGEILLLVAFYCNLTEQNNFSSIPLTEMGSSRLDFQSGHVVFTSEKSQILRVCWLGWRPELGPVWSILAVPWQRKLLTLLGLKESVGKCDCVNPCHSWVLVKLWVNVEEDGHIDLLVRIQPLLFKAETLWAEQSCYHRRQWCTEADELDSPLYLDLVEVLAGFEGDHIVGGDASDGFICRILRSVERQCRLTRNHLPRKHRLLRTRSRM